MRFIHEHNLPTCVILLTGHKNFEYARSAIEYRVKRYLLKPITVPQLKAVFRETCAALDDHLNEHGYIVPGLGDAGDRIFGTK